MPSSRPICRLKVALNCVRPRHLLLPFLGSQLLAVFFYTKPQYDVTGNRTSHMAVVPLQGVRSVLQVEQLLLSSL